MAKSGSVPLGGGSGGPPVGPPIEVNTAPEPESEPPVSVNSAPPSGTFNLPPSNPVPLQLQEQETTATFEESPFDSNNMNDVAKQMLQTDLDGCRDSLSTCNQELQSITTDLQNCRDDLDSGGIELEQAQAEIERLQRDVERLRTEKEDLENQISHCRSSLQDAETSIGTLRSEYESKLAKADKDIIAGKAANAKYAKLLSESKSELKTIEESLDEIEDESQKLEVELQSAEESLQEAEESLTETKGSSKLYMIMAAVFFVLFLLCCIYALIKMRGGDSGDMDYRYEAMPAATEMAPVTAPMAVPVAAPVTAAAPITPSI